MLHIRIFLKMKTVKGAHFTHRIILYLGKYSVFGNYTFTNSFSICDVRFS